VESISSRFTPPATPLKAGEQVVIRLAHAPRSAANPVQMTVGLGFVAARLLSLSPC